MEQLALGGTMLAHVAMGVALAATAGLRAFLPLLVVGVAARLDWVSLPERFDWLASTPALVVFAAAVAAELAGDKVPAVDHLLDGLAIVVKPLAGAFVMLAAVGEWSPLYLAVLWIVLGGSLAAGVHVAKANLRLLSTATTGGLANPVLSLLEDLGALAAAVGAVLLPLLVVTLMLLVGAVVWLVLRRARRPPQLA